jgi:hypothetical protein
LKNNDAKQGGNMKENIEATKRSFSLEALENNETKQE